MRVPPGSAEGARLLSATEVAEDSTAESGFVGFLTAALGGGGRLSAFYGVTEKWKGKSGHTFEIAATVGLEFLAPSPDGVEN